jgi:type I site-specific restriction endonuclease
MPSPGVYAIDMASGEEGPVATFPSPQELWSRRFAEENPWRDRFAAVPYPDKGGSWQIRFYQDIAVTRVLEAIATGSNRILLTLAAGTGKTSIAFQILWKLFQARWNLSGEPTRRPRILFLADRNTLTDQAYNDFTGFAAFEDNALARLEHHRDRTARTPAGGDSAQPDRPAPQNPGVLRHPGACPRHSRPDQPAQEQQRSQLLPPRHRR